MYCHIANSLDPASCEVTVTPSEDSPQLSVQYCGADQDKLCWEFKVDRHRGKETKPMELGSTGITMNLFEKLAPDLDVGFSMSWVEVLQMDGGVPAEIDLFGVGDDQIGAFPGSLLGLQGQNRMSLGGVGANGKNG